MDEAPDTADSKSDRKLRFELHKLEYQIVTQRYENIYRAIWQNFSYMGAAAAGILAFGARTWPTPIACAVASIPILFWLVVTYVPMDHYARQARARAGD